MLKSACTLAAIPFYWGFFKNKKWPRTSFHATFFVEIFDKIFLLQILQKLGKPKKPNSN